MKGHVLQWSGTPSLGIVYKLEVNFLTPGDLNRKKVEVKT